MLNRSFVSRFTRNPIIRPHDAFCYLLLFALLTISTPLLAALSFDPVGYQLIGRGGGSAKCVAIKGRYAYAGVGHQLLVFDLMLPTKASPVLQSSTLPAPIAAIAIKDDLAVLAVNEAGIILLDISRPNRPRLLGTLVTTGPAKDIALQNNIAYITTGTAMRLIDIGDPANPVEVGAYEGPQVEFLDVRGQYAYLNGNNSIRVIDISNPGNPVEAGIAANPGGVGGLKIHKRHLYAAAAYAGLLIYNISEDPVQPRLVAGSRSSFPEDAHDVLIANGHAYVADRDVIVGEALISGGLRIVNVETPSQPVEVGRISGDLWSVAIADGLLVAADYDTWHGATSSIDFINISIPQQPTRVASFPSSTNVDSLTVSGTDVYTLDSNLHRIDLSNPSAPQSVFALPLPGDDYFYDQLLGVAIDGQYAFVGGGSAGLHVVDMSDKKHPQHLLTFTEVAAGQLVKHGHLIIAEGAYGELHLIDVSNPLAPVLRSTITGEWSITDLAVQGNYLFAANYAYPADSAIMVFDISDPAAPVPVNVIPIPSSGKAAGIAVANNYLYLATTFAAQDLYIFDITDLLSPVIVGSLLIPPHHITDMTLAGDHLYLAQPVIPTGGLFTIDVSTPAQPQLIGTFLAEQFDAYAQSVAVLPAGQIVVGTSNGYLVVEEQPLSQ